MLSLPTSLVSLQNSYQPQRLDACIGERPLFVSRRDPLTTTIGRLPTGGFLA